MMEMPEERGCLGVVFDLLFGPSVMVLLLIVVLL